MAAPKRGSGVNGVARKRTTTSSPVVEDCKTGADTLKPHVADGTAEESLLKRLRLQSQQKESGLYKRIGEVTKRQGWTEGAGGKICHVEVASERIQPLKKRAMLGAFVLVAVYALLINSALQAQIHRWQALPEDDIALKGPDGSTLVPFLFCFWYLVVCFFMSRRMSELDPIEPIVFEAMILYNVFQAAASAYVAIGVFSEWRQLSMSFVGNPAPVHDIAHHRLGSLAILHYHLRILELMDTFFLILRKKIGRSVLLHGTFRMQSVWTWHVVCRMGCGGDMYFPLVVNAFGCTVLHTHYVLALMEPRMRKPPWPFNYILREGHSQQRRKAVMALQVWLLCATLCYNIASLVAGAYPASILVMQMTQLLLAMAFFSNFHYEETNPQAEAQLDEADDAGALAVSFDSSGWCYLYHFGVALWIQEHFAAEIDRGEIQFSGSSGGAIVGYCLAAKLDIAGAVHSVLHVTWPRSRFRPWQLPAEVQETLEKFSPPNGHEAASGKLRILTTRATPQPPFFMGEVFSQFRSLNHVFSALHASSHMPFIFGLGYKLDGARYFDGLLWPSSFVPWRTFSATQRVCRVSAFSAVGSDVGPRWDGIPPFWWPVFPPSQEALEGLMWAGYRDIAAIFGTAEKRTGGLACARRLQKGALANGDVPTTEHIDKLIRIYECTARRHWAMMLGTVFFITTSLLLFWLRFLAM
eukprot:TRINITY_DN100501_c0_g1_i1.p1 TRINITY_DN100501_c0_g1~~TRINITY_DN100501_c0_g1_i1.p1  ORF type:complete len:696 (-),score=105.25 TRINITY_DN100501_c0_g1_i1:155-2242(-)